MPAKKIKKAKAKPKYKMLRVRNDTYLRIKSLARTKRLSILNIVSDSVDTLEKTVPMM